jgi:hypothetical protein
MSLGPKQFPPASQKRDDHQQWGGASFDTTTSPAGRFRDWLYQRDAMRWIASHHLFARRLAWAAKRNPEARFGALVQAIVPIGHRPGHKLYAHIKSTLLGGTQ